MRPRPTTRLWMVVVAGVALTFAGWNDLRHRGIRNRMARIEAHYRKLAERHEREQSVCEERASRGDPYPRTERMDDLYRSKLLYEPESFDHPTRDWDAWTDEADYHAGYALEHRQREAAYASSRRDAERYLIFP